MFWASKGLRDPRGLTVHVVKEVHQELLEKREKWASQGFQGTLVHPEQREKRDSKESLEKKAKREIGYTAVPKAKFQFYPN